MPGALLGTSSLRSAVALLWPARDLFLADFCPIPKTQKNGRIATPPKIIKIQHLCARGFDFD